MYSFMLFRCLWKEVNEAFGMAVQVSSMYHFQKCGVQSYIDSVVFSISFMMRLAMITDAGEPIAMLKVYW